MQSIEGFMGDSLARYRFGIVVLCRLLAILKDCMQLHRCNYWLHAPTNRSTVNYQFFGHHSYHHHFNRALLVQIVSPPVEKHFIKKLVRMISTTGSVHTLPYYVFLLTCFFADGCFSVSQGAARQRYRLQCHRYVGHHCI